MDIFKFIQQCRALNFDGIDPHMNNLGGTGKDHLKKVRRMALDSGLSIASMCVSTEFGRDAAAVPAQIEKAREAIEVGMMLGAPVLRVFVGSAPTPEKTEEAFQRGADALRKCAEYGAEMGMPVALQNHSGLTSTGDDMLKFYKTVNHPNFTLLLDTGHFTGRDGPNGPRSLVTPMITTTGASSRLRRSPSSCAPNSTCSTIRASRSLSITSASLTSCEACTTTGSSVSYTRVRRTR